MIITAPVLATPPRLQSAILPRRPRAAYRPRVFACARGAEPRVGGNNDSEQSKNDDEETRWGVLRRRVSEMREQAIELDRQCAKNWKHAEYSTSIVALVPGSDCVRRISVDDQFVACGTANGAVCLFNLATNSRVIYLNATQGQTTSVCLQGAYLATVGANDKSIVVWNIGKYRTINDWERVQGGELTEGDGITLPPPTFKLYGHTNYVTSVKIDAIRKRLYSASTDGTIHCWCLQTGQLLRVVRVGEPVLCMTMTEKGYALVGCQSGRVQAYQIDKGLHLLSIYCHHANVTALCFRDETQTLATGDADGNLKLWSFDDARCIKSFPKHDRAVMAIQIDDTKLVSASRDGTVGVSSIAKQDRMYSIGGYTGFVSSLYFDNKRLLSDGTNNVIISHQFDTE